ncbi:hypothetical protein CMV_027542, partial [Castanea mollissima]
QWTSINVYFYVLVTHCFICNLEILN